MKRAPLAMWAVYPKAAKAFEDAERAHDTLNRALMASPAAAFVLVDEIAAGDPMVENVGICGDSVCYFCGKTDLLIGDFEHEPDCLWLRARAQSDARAQSPRPQ